MLSVDMTRSATRMVVMACQTVLHSLRQPSSGQPSTKSLTPIQAMSSPPRSLTRGTSRRLAAKKVRATRTATAPPAPSAMPSRRFCRGRFLTARAMTTALSPASTRSMSTMPAKAERVARSKAKGVSNMKVV